MAIKDRVQPLKLEDPGTGGEQTDFFPTALNKNEDYIDCHGIVIQNEFSNDGYVRVERSDSGNELQFTDSSNLIPITLSSLLSAGSSSIFGQNYASASSLLRSTTTSSVFQDKVRLVSPEIIGMLYINWFAVVDTQSANKLVKTRLFNDTDMVVLGANQSHYCVSTTETRHVGGIYELQLNGESKTLKIQFCSPNGITTVGIQNAMIACWRVA